MPDYCIYGLVFTSKFELKTKLYHPLSKTEVKDFIFTCSNSPPDGINPADNKLIHQSKLGHLKIHENHGWEVIEYPDRDNYYLNEKRIHCSRQGRFSALQEIRLIGFVISYWAGRYKHDLMIHASTVGHGNKAIVFTAGNSGGKTSLATSMIQNTNYSFMADDILRMSLKDEQLICYPAYPQIRLWPDQIKILLKDSSENHEIVHPDYEKRRIKLPHPQLSTLYEQTCNKAIIYQPNRSKSVTNITIKPLSSQQTFLLLKSNLFTRDLLEVNNNLKDYFLKITTLINKISAFELIYPDGYKLLPSVCERISKHADAVN